MSLTRRIRQSLQNRRRRHFTRSRRIGIELLESRRVLSTVTFDADPTIVEGNSGTTALVFTVRRDANDGAETVDFSVADGDGATATLGVDFVNVVGTLDFNNGADLTDTISVQIIGDTILELDETFFVDLSNPTGGMVIGDDEAIGTIQNDDTASLSVTSVSANEGDTVNITYLFVATLSGSVDTPFTVDASTLEVLNSATAGVDFTAKNEKLSFAGTSGEQKMFNVQVIGDTVPEPTETFTISLTNLQANSRPINLTNGTGTIVNDDAALTVTNVVTNEGDAGNTSFDFTVTLAGTTPSSLSVDIATAEVSGGATAGTDFTANSTTLNFNGTDGEQRTFSVQVAGETLVEADEMFAVNLSNRQGGGLAIDLNNGTGTITNDDSATLTVTSVSLNEGNAGETAFDFVVTMSGSVDIPITVDATTLEVLNSATAGEDYTTKSETLNFSGTDGQQQTFTVQVTGDTIPEPTETFTIDLNNAQAGGRPINLVDGTGTIVNDDASLVVTSVVMNEGDAGNTSFDFIVTSSGGTPDAFTVDIATVELPDGATAGVDFTANSTTLNFAGTDGEQRTFSVQVAGDTLVEVDEMFAVNLTNVQSGGFPIPLTNGTGTITNDDTATLTVTSVSANEGNAGNTAFDFVVTLSGDVDTPFTVDAATLEVLDSATPGVDYQAKTETLNFTGTNGEQQTFTVQVIGDTLPEPTETFNVELTNLQAAGRAIDLVNGTGTIVNDDATLTVSNVVMNEGNAGTTSFDFTVTLAGETPAPLTVDIATVEIASAVAGVDFTANSTTLNFNGTDGEQQTFSVEVLGDNLVEADEMFAVNLSNLQSGGFGIALTNGTGTITNDDAATLMVTNVSDVEGNIGETAFNFLVTLSGDVDTAFSVDAATLEVINGATADVDYAAKTETLNFSGASGEQQMFTVQVIGDAVPEPTEAFTVGLSNLQPSGRTINLVNGTGAIVNDDASLTVTSVVMNEGDAGNTSFDFIVTLAGEAPAALTVDIATAEVANGATAAADFAARSTTLNFTGTDGEQRTFSVQVVGETLVEADEMFAVNLSNLQSGGFEIALSGGAGTIQNDDAAIVTAAGESAAEATGVVNFVVSLSNPVDTAVTVDLSTADDTAMAGTDYTAIASQQVTFSAGETSKLVMVAVVDDMVVERDETIGGELSNLNAPQRNVTLNAASTPATILNDDMATLAVSSVSLAEGDDGNTAFEFTATLTGDVDTAFTVDIATGEVADGATSGTDFTANNATLNFAGNDGDEQTFTVQVTGEDLVEKDEMFAVLLGNLQAADRVITLADGAGTIINDDMTNLSIAAAQAAVTEGNAGVTPVMYTVTASHAVQGGFTVALNAAGAAADDFNLSANAITFVGDVAQEQQTFFLNVVGDLLVELDETVTITLGEVSGTAIGVDPNTIGTGAMDSTTITNDDLATIVINDITAAEGNGPGDTAFLFTVSLDNRASHDITVVANSAATQATGGGIDFTDVVNTTVTIPAGESSATLTVNVTGENLVELDEAFQVNLSAARFNGTMDATRAVADDAPGTATITNDDAAILSIADMSQAEGDSGLSAFQFTLTLSNPVDANVTFNATTSDGTALAGQDYIAADAVPLAINAMGTSGLVTVQVIGETLFEAGETFNVILGNLAASGRNVSFGDAEALGTIVNDDTRVAGFTYLDANGNGQRDDGEVGLAGVLITVTRTDVIGVTPTREILTDLDGRYVLMDQPAGTYTVTQRQPLAMVDGEESIGSGASSPGNSNVNDSFQTIVLAAGNDAQDYNFGELRTVTPVSMRWYLASSAALPLLFRERIANAEELAGNTELADQIRAGESMETVVPEPPPAAGEGEQKIVAQSLPDALAFAVPAVPEPEADESVRPVVEEPVVEEPVVEEPVRNEPEAEVPVAEVPEAEARVAEAAATDEPPQEETGNPERESDTPEVVLLASPPTDSVAPDPEDDPATVTPADALTPETPAPDPTEHLVTEAAATEADATVLDEPKIKSNEPERFPTSDKLDDAGAVDASAESTVAVAPPSARVPANLFYGPMRPAGWVPPARVVPPPTPPPTPSRVVPDVAGEGEFKRCTLGPRRPTPVDLSANQPAPSSSPSSGANDQRAAEATSAEPIAAAVDQALFEVEDWRDFVGPRPPR